jgi:hypothetical protein
MSKSFLVLFFKKELLPSVTQGADKKSAPRRGVMA